MRNSKPETHRHKNEIFCPKCGHKTESDVKETREAPGSTLRRRRECKICGHGHTTYEVSKDLWKLLRLAQKHSKSTVPVGKRQNS